MEVPVGNISEIVRDHRILTRVFIGLVAPEFRKIKFFPDSFNFIGITSVFDSFESDSHSLIGIFLDFCLREILIPFIIGWEEEFANLVRESKVRIEVCHELEHHVKILLILTPDCIGSYVLNSREPIKIRNDIIKSSSNHLYCGICRNKLRMIDYRLFHLHVCRIVESCIMPKNTKRHNGEEEYK